MGALFQWVVSRADAPCKLRRGLSAIGEGGGSDHRKDGRRGRTNSCHWRLV